MRRRVLPVRDWPEPRPGGPNEGCYASETQLVPGAEPLQEDPQVRALVTGLPDGSGTLRRIGICNPSGAIYREVTLHGPVQLLYLWAGLNALGFTQRPATGDVVSRFWLVFTREGTEKRPPAGGRNQATSG